MTRLTVALFMLLPAAVFAESATPSLGYTGAPTDHGGANCSTCHNSFGAANSDKSGSLQVTVADYVPSVQQLIHIKIQNPGASRFGFQMTVRGQSSETVSAGTFTIPDTATSTVQVLCDDGSQYGSAAACSGSMPRQFAEHVNAPRGTAGAVYDFDVIWTPPAQEIGRIDLYVSAVAADGDGTAKGDRVYTYSQTLNNAGGCSIAGTPIFHNVSNGASFQPGFSSLSMVSIFGDAFETSGRQRIASVGDYVNGAYPSVLGCVGVEVTGPGLTQPVELPLAYVSPGQINAQMPRFSGTGPVNLTVILNPGQNAIRSAVATLNSLQPFSPAFFTFANSQSIAAEQAGSGSIVANPSLVPGAAPAKPGDIVSLFGTGFGDTNPAVGTGVLATGAASLTNGVTVTIGGVTLSSSDVLYAGLSPGSISGLYQFNVRIPSSTAPGNVPVTISIGGVQTQAGATIPVQ